MTTNFPKTQEYMLKLVEHHDGNLQIDYIKDKEDRKKIVTCLLDDVISNNNAGHVELSELITVNPILVLPLFKFISKPLEHERANTLSEELVDHIFNNLTYWLNDIIDDAEKEYNSQPSDYDKDLTNEELWERREFLNSFSPVNVNF